MVWILMISLLLSSNTLAAPTLIRSSTAINLGVLPNNICHLTHCSSIDIFGCRVNVPIVHSLSTIGNASK